MVPGSLLRSKTCDECSPPLNIFLTGKKKSFVSLGVHPLGYFIGVTDKLGQLQPRNLLNETTPRLILNTWIRFKKFSLWNFSLKTDAPSGYEEMISFAVFHKAKLVHESESRASKIKRVYWWTTTGEVVSSCHKKRSYIWSWTKTRTWESLPLYLRRQSACFKKFRRPNNDLLQLTQIVWVYDGMLRKIPLAIGLLTWIMRFDSNDKDFCILLSNCVWECFAKFRVFI